MTLQEAFFKKKRYRIRLRDGRLAHLYGQVFETTDLNLAKDLLAHNASVDTSREMRHAKIEVVQTYE